MKNILLCYQNGFFQQNGGVQKYCTLLGDFLEENGFNVFFLSLIQDNEFKKIKNDKFFVLPNQFDLYCKENVLFYENLIKTLIIFAVINNEATNNRFSFFRPSKNLYVKHIAIFHQNPLLNLDFDFQYGFFNQALMKLKIFKRKLKIKYLINNTDKLLFLSPKYVTKIKENLNLKSKKLVAISNSVKIKDENCNSSEKSNIVLFVGRLDEVKQVDLLIQAWEFIESENKNWDLVIMGDGPQSNQLKDLANKLELSRISFTGKADPIDYYRKSKILCLPSKYEGFGLVLVEAMAFGVVPIAFNNWLALSDIISDKIDGIIVEDKTVTGLHIALESIIDNQVLNEMSINAISKAKKFDIKSLGMEWVNLLKSL